MWCSVVSWPLLCLVQHSGAYFLFVAFAALLTSNDDSEGCDVR